MSRPNSDWDIPRHRRTARRAVPNVPPSTSSGIEAFQLSTRRDEYHFHNGYRENQHVDQQRYQESKVLLAHRISFSLTMTLRLVMYYVADGRTTRNPAISDIR